MNKYIVIALALLAAVAFVVLLYYLFGSGETTTTTTAKPEPEPKPEPVPVPNTDAETDVPPDASGTSTQTQTPPPPPITREYDFYPYMDSPGYDVTQTPDLIDKPADLMLACDKIPGCLGFNTNGWMKRYVQPKGSWQRWTDNPAQGFYVLKGTQI